MLLYHLPGDSVTARAIHGDGTQWTATNYQLADLFDLTMAIHHANATAGTKHHKPKPPAPYPRPGDRTAGDDGELSTPDQVRAFFGPASITYVGQGGE